MIVADWLHRQAAVRSRAPALVSPDAPPLAFGALDERVERLRRRLHTAGIRPGDRVACVLPNGAALVELVHAVARAGAALAPLDPRGTSAELTRLVRLVRPRMVVVAPETQPAVGECNASVHVCLPGAEPLAEIAPAAGAPRPVLDLDAPHTIVFTSGTSTGEPRAVVLTAGNHLWSALGSGARLGTHRDDRWLACMPLHHVGGLAILVRSAVLGAAVVLHRRFDAGAVGEALDEHHVTLLSVVPTMLARLLDAVSERRAGALRCVLVGGAAASAELLERARAAGVPVAATYGLTEAASQVATAIPGERPSRPGGVGHPLPATHVRIVAREGRPARAGESGEIHVQGATVSPGRLAADGRLVPLTTDGWLPTGDLGCVDGDGALTVIGRRDDVIVTGGENVSPDEVEAALLAEPSVADAGVAGLPDDEWGQIVAAWVVPRSCRPPALEELRTACRRRLAPHKLPRRLFVVPALPRTVSGKLQRFRLQTLPQR